MLLTDPASAAVAAAPTAMKSATHFRPHVNVVALEMEERPSTKMASPQQPEAVDMLSSPLITGNRGTIPVTSPSMSKLPGLQYAISHRRTDLRLPSFMMPYDGSSSQDSPSPAHSEHRSSSNLQLSVPHCETPHFMPGIASFCPETSPTEKKPACSLALSLENCSADELKRRKKGTRRGTLNPEAKNVLKAWMFSPEHFAHPYPSEEEKEELASEAGIEVKQLSNWFTNARKRLWQPVLRQSGVEVKNFLSTGRGGPRGNKLDVPANLQHLVSPSPPSSPERPSSLSPERSTSPLKRTWLDIEASLPSAASSADESASSTSSSSSSRSAGPHDAGAAAPKRKKTSGALPTARKKASKDHSGTDAPAATTRKEDAPAMTKIANQLSQELRIALAERAAVSVASSSRTMTNPATTASFQDLEILAATSLIGLHQQYQSVH